MADNHSSVGAVVVTFNRKDLLLECLDAIEIQTHKVSAIYIVDNASTDGTENILYKEGYIDELPPQGLKDNWIKEFNHNDLKVYYIRMSENTGGAGGFYEGMKKAHNEGYDWLWLMDDDGKPDKQCLEKLLVHKNEADFLAPLVVNIDNENELSFGIQDIVHQKKLNTVLEAKTNAQSGTYPDTANPFNGILLSKKLIDSIGFPIKEMFIWGDEAEYFVRTKQNGFKILTVVDAIHRHPKQKKDIVNIFFNKYSLMYDESPLKYYCYIRNQAYRYKIYNKRALPSSFLKYVWMFLVTRKMDLRGLGLYINAFMDGVLGNMDNHKKFLH